MSLANIDRAVAGMQFQRRARIIAHRAAQAVVEKSCAVTSKSLLILELPVSALTTNCAPAAG